MIIVLTTSSPPGPTKVAVKMLKEMYTATEVQDLISEYSLLKEVDHPNVIKLLGACTDRRGPFYLIMEFAEHGSLRNYLRRSRQRTDMRRLSSHSSGESHSTITTEGEPYLIQHKDIINYACQIARGMAYLADIKVSNVNIIQLVGMIDGRMYVVMFSFLRVHKFVLSV